MRCWADLLVLAHLCCGHTHVQLAAGFGVDIATVYCLVIRCLAVRWEEAPLASRLSWQTST